MIFNIGSPAKKPEVRPIQPNQANANITNVSYGQKLIDNINNPNQNGIVKVKAPKMPAMQNNLGWQQKMTQNTMQPNPSTYAEGNVGVRQTLNGMGIDDSRIGWVSDPNGGGSVTVDGTPVAKSNDLRDGSAYADANSIANGTVQGIASGGNVVAAADYAASSGSPLSIGYNNGMVSVNGVMVKPTAVVNGKAYVTKSDMDNAISQANAQNGIRSNQSIVDTQNSKYGSVYQRLLDNITNREAFSYDPETDPAYNSYKKMYTREGTRAMQDTIGNMAGLTGGLASSAGVSAGAQANNYYMQQLTDKIPQLFDSAYNRYVNEFNMDNQALDSVMGVDDMQFGRNYNANRDTVGDVRDSRDFGYNRKRHAVGDDQWQQTFDENTRQFNVGADQWNKNFAFTEKEYNEITKPTSDLNLEGMGLQNDRTENENYALAKANAVESAKQRGYYSEDEAYIIFGDDWQAHLGDDPWAYDEKALMTQANANIYQDQGIKQNSANFSGGSGGGGRSGGSGSSGRSGGGSSGSGYSDSEGDYGAEPQEAPIEDYESNPKVQGVINSFTKGVIYNNPTQQVPKPTIELAAQNAGLSYEETMYVLSYFGY